MGWEKKLLGDVLELKRGYDLPKNNRESGDVQVISSSGPSGYHSSAKVPGPGVVTGRYGTIGEVFYSNDDFWPLNTSLYVRDFKGNDPKFVYYFLKTLNWQQFNDKSGVPGVNRNHVHEAEIVYPNTLAEQKNVASILSALDDKIELNRQMNETLEEMARSTFKSWFVDFDPVVAKAAGQAPAHMSAQTAALFPASFNEEGLPDGWVKKPVSDFIELIGGGTPKRKVSEYWNGSIPWFSVVDAPNHSDVWILGTKEQITQKGLDESSTKLLPIETTIITARGTVGKVAFLGVPTAMNQSCYGIRGRSHWGQRFTYFLIRQMVEELKAKAHGSVFDTITRDTFKMIWFPEPLPKIAQVFEEFTNPILDKIKANVEQNQTLADLRDTLLPKLMSGEIRLRDVEKAVEKVS